MNTQETTTKAETANPKKAKASKKLAKTKKAATPKKTAKAKGAAKPGSKAEIVLELMKRKEGATLAEIAKATDWQNHSIRGFVSGHVTSVGKPGSRWKTIAIGAGVGVVAVFLIIRGSYGTG